MKRAANKVIQTAVNISVQNRSELSYSQALWKLMCAVDSGAKEIWTVSISGTLKGYMWSGQRGKNRYELSYCQELWKVMCGVDSGAEQIWIVLLSGIVKVNVCSGQRGKNRSELSYCQELWNLMCGVDSGARTVLNCLTVRNCGS
jgi:hypothetical protein